MFYQDEKNKIIQELNSDEDHGLTLEQVSASSEKYGSNEFKEAPKESTFAKLLRQFKDPLVILLIIAAIISYVVDPNEIVDSVIILVVVIFNALLGLYQETNAEKSLESLKKLSAPTAKVIREGKRVEIPSKDVVVGDVMLIEAGDFIASDARVIESFNLQIDESALTGESLPVNKIDAPIQEDDIALGDQKNMVFQSTICTYGRGKAIVTSVGMENEIGKIASMLQEDDDNTTPLQLKLAQISKVIGIMCVVICAVVFGLEVMSGLSVLEAFKTAIALAVASIPEGLASVVTIVLALGVNAMVKKNSIVRRLPAVETLGSCNVICSDKTGTLTQNKMTVTDTYLAGKEIKKIDFDDQKTREMMGYFTLCSDGEVIQDREGVHLYGDPTETALVYASYKYGDYKEDLYKKCKRINEIAFDSSRKLMSVFYEVNGRVLQVTKGAPDILMSRCDNTHKEDYEVNYAMASQALRVLGVAIAWYDEMPEIDFSLENHLTFVGLAGMIDPPRLEVKKSIEEAKRGGIKTIMITGDHLVTAEAIAKNLGILEDGQLAIEGKELDKMTDLELDEQLDKIRVYARVAPEHKVRIVKAWQRKGAVVAMTGDGVNDSPALKTADIGCAMGITGTDVSKNAADMVLADDNFATIIEAVKKGRGIYSNIKKDVQFLLSSNIGEVLCIFLASIIGAFTQYNLGVPLMPIHLLWINLITDSLPAFALGMEETDPNIINEKPRRKDESFFANGLTFTIIWQGILIGLLSLGAYLIGNNINHVTGMTMAFVTLALTQLIHAFNIKSSQTVFSRQVFNNKYLWMSLLAGVCLQLVIIYVPAFADAFTLTPLTFQQMGISVLLAFVPLMVVEVIKFFKSHRIQKIK